MIGAVLALQFIGPATKPPPPAPAPTPCLQKGEEISGEMRWVESRHVGNHKDLRVPFIVLVEPRCVRNADGDTKTGRWVQLGLTLDAMKKLKPGDTVTVKGDYIVPFTAYHLGDIVAMDAVVVKETAP